MSVWIEGAWLNLEYEGLSMICFECGKFGHSKEECMKDNETDVEVNQAPVSWKKPGVVSEPLFYGP